MNWIITENKEQECPGFAVDYLPCHITAKLRIMYKDQQLYLVADGIAGVIPCKRGHSITILPKCKELNPFSMYEYITGLAIQQENKQSIDFNGSGIDLSTVAFNFAHELIAIQCHQKLFKRLPVRQSESVIKGHVDWVSTGRSMAVGNNNIITTTMISTYDIPENEIISMAASTCLSLFDNDTPEWKILHFWASKAYKKRLIKETLFKLQGRLRNSQISGAHAYYYRPICLALIILGVDYAGNMNAQDQAILFNMPGLYEDYVRTAFMRRSILKGYSCQKSFVPRSYLFTDGTCELEPDITIYAGSCIKAVLDAKYKTPDSKDYYQLFTYMKYAGLREAYFISPSVHHMETITSYDGSKIINLRVFKSDNKVVENMAEDILKTI